VLFSSSLVRYDASSTQIPQIISCPDTQASAPTQIIQS
jgi:hypothetical protein